MSCAARYGFAAALLLWGGGLGAYTEPANDFHFSIVGDRTGAASPGIYERVWREVDALNPAFVINTGDTIEGGDDARAEQEWLALRPLWGRTT